MMPFGARLRATTDARGPLCAGLDPHPELLTAWGLPVDAGGLRAFCEIAVDALGEQVAVLKPQSAFFERFGSAGIAVLEWTLRAVREAGSIALLDVKRGDIGATMSAYAAAYLDPTSPLAADAITVSPYLGFGSLQPALDLAAQHGRGLFVLALTSNPEGPQVQHARTAAGASVAQEMIDAVAAYNAGAEPLGDVGLVVGATVGDTGHRLTHVNGPLLAPGFGAQGGTVEDLRRVFGAALPNALPATSRGLLRHGPDRAALRAAARRLRDSLSG